MHLNELKSRHKNLKKNYKQQEISLFPSSSVKIEISSKKIKQLQTYIRNFFFSILSLPVRTHT